VVQYILQKNIKACRKFNQAKKLPHHIAQEHNASEYLMNMLARADHEARNKELGWFSLLWG